MAEVKEFARALRDILQPIFPEEPHMVVNIMFNILLVKFAARPSMLEDYYIHSDKLNADAAFIGFIRDDPDLAVGWFKTERSSHKDFVVYNRQFSRLFVDEDISDKPNSEIHIIRGTRLGFPYVTPNFQDPTLLSVDMMIQVSQYSWAPFYSYRCPDNDEHILKAMQLWQSFREYAKVLGRGLQINIS